MGWLAWLLLQGGGCQQMAQAYCLMLSVSLSKDVVAQQGQLFVPKEKAEDILSFWLSPRGNQSLISPRAFVNNAWLLPMTALQL